MRIGIVGDGITGLLLAWELQKTACEVALLGNGSMVAASLESAAVLTPLANKKNDILPDYERLLDIALEMYTGIAAYFRKAFVRPIPLVKQGTVPGNNPYFEATDIGTVSPFWELPGPFMNVLNAWKVNTGIITVLRQHLESTGIYTRSAVAWNADTVRKLEEIYDLIICCEGAAVRCNPLFAHIPFTKNKGDVMLVQIPQLPGNSIYDFRYKLVPLQQDLFWLGSNNIWQYETVQPEPSFRSAAEIYLSHSLKIPFRVLRHVSVERPTIAGQQALACPHPEHTSIWCVNGLGSRGFLKAPALIREVLTHIL